jgi:hypothetical protein
MSNIVVMLFNVDADLCMPGTDTWPVHRSRMSNTGHMSGKQDTTWSLILDSEVATREQRKIFLKNVSDSSPLTL